MDVASHPHLNGEEPMMSLLAQRVRDYRYSKGWGPDELANRAAISRTALYQIESGKTELPRAGTLRRIALALDVSMETLLGHADGGVGGPHAGPSHPSANAVDAATRQGRASSEWYPTEGSPLAVLTTRGGSRFEGESRFGIEFGPTSVPTFENGLSSREREIMGKLHDLLASPFGDAISRI